MVLLSICIPTYNRAKYLDITLNRITQEDIFLNTDKIEIVISDNASEDNTQEVCEYYAKLYPQKIKYYRQQENIGDENFPFVLNHANGIYAKLNNDSCFFAKDKLEEFINIIKKYPDQSVYFITNQEKENEIIECKNADDFFKHTSFYNTWIAGFCVKTELYKKIENPTKYTEQRLCQVDILGRLINNQKSIVINKNMLFIQDVGRKRGYNVAEVFGKNYFLILKDLIKQKLISKKTYEFIKHDILPKHINAFYFDYKKQHDFYKTGYFRYLLKDYWYNWYFYIDFINSQIILFFHQFKIYRFLYRQIKKIVLAKRWKKLNSHNFLKLKNPLDYKNIIAGKYSYGVVDALFNSNTGEKLYIGNYCSIAPNVLFIVASDHGYKGISTYPFKVMIAGEKFEALSKGDIIVKDDVWIGANSTILSGVTINQGAVVAAGSVVTKDIPPYAIVGGNPARVIKYRFSDDIINKLLKIDYSKLSKETILDNIPNLYTEINDDNVDEIIESLKIL